MQKSYYFHFVFFAFLVFIQNTGAHAASGGTLTFDGLSCQEYLLSADGNDCQVISKNRAKLYQTMDKVELMSSLDQMIKKNDQFSEVDVNEVTMAHALAICKQVNFSDANGGDAPVLDVSLFSQNSIKTWMQDDPLKRLTLQALLKEGREKCVSQLSAKKDFQEDIKIALTEKSESLRKKSASYATMVGRLRESLRSPFEELLEDPEVAVDLAIFRKKMEGIQSQRFSCQYQEVLKKIEKNNQMKEGLKNAAKDSALNVASLVIGPEMFVAGTLTKATLSLEKIENLMMRLYVHTKNLSPRNLKELSRNSQLVKELDVDPKVISEMPEILRDNYKVGYGEFMDRIGLDHTLYKQPYLGSELQKWESSMNSSYRQAIVSKVKEMAAKGVSVNPNNISKRQSAEFLVSRGVYPNEPRVLLNKIVEEFGSYQNFSKYIKPGK